MNIQHLEARRRELRDEARAILAKMKSAKAEPDLRRLEAEHDDVMLAYDEVADEIEDIRLQTDVAREARLAKRPGADPIDTRTDADPAIDESPALKPEQRMTVWAQARTPATEDYRGLSLGGYFRSMLVGGKTDVERRALSEGSDSAGGYTVPDILSAQLIDLARARSVVTAAGAMTVPLGSDQNRIAKLLTDPVPAWRNEAGAVATSDSTFGPVDLVPRSLAVQTFVSAELLEDTLNLATELPRVMAAAMAVELDRVALIGSGTAPEPRGIANTSGIGTFAQNAVIANYSGLSRARTGILSANHTPTAYIMHPRDEGAFTDLVDSDGQPLQAPRAVSDIRMLTTTSIPTDGGAGDDESTIIAGDFTRLLLGIRSDIRVEILKTSTYASNLQYAMVAHMRADVAVTHPGAFYTLTGVGRAA
ncbi:MAG: phage major capsid protein [Roseovarius sp.]|nr:phage major capsid protein [Roseovarius sp.]